MAFPFLLASIAAAVGSSLLDAQAQKRVEKEKKKKFGQETARQDQLRSDAKKRFTELLATQTPEQQNEMLNTQKQQLGDYYTSDNSDEMFTDMLPGQGNASDAVRQEIVKTSGDAQTSSNRMSRRLADLDSYKGVQMKNQNTFRDTRQNIGMIGAESKRSSDILPLELQAAESKGGGLRALSGLLKVGGQIAGAAGAAGVGGDPALTGIEMGAKGAPQYVFTKPGFFKDTLYKSRFPTLEPQIFPVK